jgi:Rps23 Pro-64 3,4-dihydroxylase Tpa1-like proline 4-hydroxylase
LNPVIYADKIFYFEELLQDPNEVLRLLESADKELPNSKLITKWEEWRSSNDDHIFGYRKSTNSDSFSFASDDLKTIYLAISSALDHAGSSYSKSLGIPLGTQAPISISKYVPNAYMGPHADEGHRSHISAVLYLNDNFEGGGLEFPNQGVFIKPKAGSIIVFPSVQPFVHDPKPADGVKYISPAFWFLDNSPLIQA